MKCGICKSKKDFKKYQIAFYLWAFDKGERGAEEWGYAPAHE